LEYAYDWVLLFAKEPEKLQCYNVEYDWWFLCRVVRMEIYTGKNDYVEESLNNLFSDIVLQ